MCWGGLLSNPCQVVLASKCLLIWIPACALLGALQMQRSAVILCRHGTQLLYLRYKWNFQNKVVAKAAGS